MSKGGHCIVSSPNFGDYFICLNDATAPTPEIANYDLAQQFSNETLIVVGEIVRNAGEWVFEAQSEARTGGLQKYLEELGFEIG